MPNDPLHHLHRIFGRQFAIGQVGRSDGQRRGQLPSSLGVRTVTYGLATKNTASSAHGAVLKWFRYALCPLVRNGALTRLLSLLLGCSHTAPISPSSLASVVKVHDGDTLEVLLPLSP